MLFVPARLHMLREVEQSVKSLLVVATDDPDGGVHRSVVADWESRLHITQVCVLFYRG